LYKELPDMAATPSENYSVLDVPEVLTRLFHPRPEITAFGLPTSTEEVLIPVASGVVVGALAGENPAHGARRRA